MNDPDATVIAEAAVWLARLRSGQPELGVQREFRHWLDGSAEHRSAFETVSDTWELAGGVRQQQFRRETSRWQTWRVPAITASAIIIAALFSWHVQRDPQLATAVGERRSVTLADGSTVVLNTNTEMRWRFSDDKRRVLLDRGEASFVVAKDTLRPFIVEAGDTKVVALGTDFDVRWIGGTLAVTLAEGRVRVIDHGEGGNRQEVELKPGQRLEERNRAVELLNGVNLENLRAWQSGEVVFDETPLTAAVAEMNRYSDRRIELVGRGAERVKISGSFKAGGSISFAKAIRDLFAFELMTDGEHIVIRPRNDKPKNIS